MEKEEFLKSGLLECYVMGLADEQQTVICERMLAEHPDIVAAKEKIEREVDRHCSNNKFVNARKKERNALVTLPLIGLCVLLAALLTMSNAHNRTLKNQIIANNADRNRLMGEARKAKDKLAILNDRMSFINHNLTAQIIGQGTEMAPEMCAKIHWNPAVSQLLVCNVEHLPQAEGKVLAIWAEVNNEMIYLGNLNEIEDQLVHKDCLSNPQSINITLEDEVLAEHPNTDMVVMVGNMPR